MKQLRMITVALSAAFTANLHARSTLPVAQDSAKNISRQLARVQAEIAPRNRTALFQPTWASLAQYRTPDWFRDAKFGIFIHWGVYSVPAFGSEWYSRNMYVPGNADYKHHIATYGPQSAFGYKDFIPKFRAERFNAAAWVDLFVHAGARYVVPVGEHCDGFAMYASDITPWNASAMGPHRDVIGEIAAATRARGLHFGVSSHTAEHWWWYGQGRFFASDVRDQTPKPRSSMGLPQPEICQDLTEPQSIPRHPIPSTWNSGFHLTPPGSITGSRDQPSCG